MYQIPTEQLSTLIHVTSERNKLVLEYGRLSLILKDLTSQIEKCSQTITHNGELEATIHRQLQEQFGAGQIDLQRGVYVPIKAQSVDTE